MWQPWTLAAQTLFQERNFWKSTVGRQAPLVISLESPMPLMPRPQSPREDFWQELSRTSVSVRVSRQNQNYKELVCMIVGGIKANSKSIGQDVRKGMLELKYHLKAPSNPVYRLNFFFLGEINSTFKAFLLDWWGPPRWSKLSPLGKSTDCRC